MSSFFHSLRNRKQSTIATGTEPLSREDFKEAEASHDAHDSDTSSGDLTLYDRNEKEIQRHPNEITANAQEGIQKAEAAALVWSKKSILLIYAW